MSGRQYTDLAVFNDGAVIESTQDPTPEKMAVSGWLTRQNTDMRGNVFVMNEAALTRKFKSHPILLMMHDMGKPIGMDEAPELVLNDPNPGIRIGRGVLDPTSAIKAWWALIKNGIVKQFSSGCRVFGMDPIINADNVQTGYRIHDWYVFEGSIVSIGANPTADMDKVDIMNSIYDVNVFTGVADRLLEQGKDIDYATMLMSLSETEIGNLRPPMFSLAEVAAPDISNILTLRDADAMHVPARHGMSGLGIGTALQDLKRHETGLILPSAPAKEQSADICLAGDGVDPVPDWKRFKNNADVAKAIHLVSSGDSHWFRVGLPDSTGRRTVIDKERLLSSAAALLGFRNTTLAFDAETRNAGIVKAASIMRQMGMEVPKICGIDADAFDLSQEFTWSDVRLGDDNHALVMAAEQKRLAGEFVAACKNDIGTILNFAVASLDMTITADSPRRRKLIEAVSSLLAAAAQEGVLKEEGDNGYFSWNDAAFRMYIILENESDAALIARILDAMESGVSSEAISNALDAIQGVEVGTAEQEVEQAPEEEKKADVHNSAPSENDQDDVVDYVTSLMR